MAKRLLEAKVNDLDRIVGILTETEGTVILQFVSQLIVELLGHDKFTKLAKIDRAHRSLTAKPLGDKHPQIIIARVHNYCDLASILQLSRQQAPQQYHGERCHKCTNPHFHLRSEGLLSLSANQ